MNRHPANRPGNRPGNGSRGESDRDLQMDFRGGSAAGFRRETECDFPGELRRRGQGDCQAESDWRLPADSQSHGQRGMQSGSQAGSQSGLRGDFGGELRETTDNNQDAKNARHTMERMKVEG